MCSHQGPRRGRECLPASARGQGVADVEALRVVAPECGELPADRLAFHTLGRYGQPKTAAQLDGRADDRLVLGVRVHVEDERLVDLDLIDLELLELGQRGVAGTEVVDRAPDAHCMERAEDLARALDVGDDLALGYLELEAV